MGQGLQEEGNRLCQGDLQGVGIQGLDAEGLGLGLTLDHLAGMGHPGQLDEPGVVGGVFGIRRPLPAIDIVRRGDRLTV
ncbi:hypothetical protein D3C79_924750 [compost metagenome]